jgi:hypothetical protein
MMRQRRGSSAPQRLGDRQQQEQQRQPLQQQRKRLVQLPAAGGAGTGALAWPEPQTRYRLPPADPLIEIENQQQAAQRQQQRQPFSNSQVQQLHGRLKARK